MHKSDCKFYCVMSNLRTIDATEVINARLNRRLMKTDKFYKIIRWTEGPGKQNQQFLIII